MRGSARRRRAGGVDGARDGGTSPLTGRERDVLVAESNAPERPERSGLYFWIMGKVQARAGAGDRPVDGAAPAEPAPVPKGALMVKEMYPVPAAACAARRGSAGSGHPGDGRAERPRLGLELVEVAARLRHAGRIALGDPPYVGDLLQQGAGHRRMLAIRAMNELDLLGRVRRRRDDVPHGARLLAESFGGLIGLLSHACGRRRDLRHGR